MILDFKKQNIILNNEITKRRGRMKIVLLESLAVSDEVLQGYAGSLNKEGHNPCKHAAFGGGD